MNKQYLRQRRTELGLTLLEVADKVGVSEATVSRWESGDIGNMGRDKIAAYAKALKVSAMVFLDDGGEVLTPVEQDLIDKYRALPDWMQRLARDNLNALYREKIEYDRIQKENEA